MATAYHNGCLRVSGPVTRSADFRSVVNVRVPSELHDIAALGRAAMVEAYIPHLRGALKRIRLYEVANTDVSLFGKTQNNLREFNFFLQLLDEQNIGFSHSFFLDDNQVVRAKISTLDAMIFEGVLEEAARWLRDAEEITGAHLHQHLQYTKNYLEITYSYQGRKHMLPRIAVVANDHSFAQVGFAAAMDGSGVPVIYLQHAEVSDIFPPLDFEASILRNRVSLDMYRAIGPIRGRTFIVSRHPGAVPYRKVLEPLPKRVVVGIYPTSEWSLPALEATIGKLRLNPMVLDYFVKLHPRSRIELAATEAERFRIRDALPDQRHIALAGNSSVVTDLLARGNPVYQLFDLDEFQPDYYGFVKTGLVPAVRTSDLDSGFWAGDFYGGTWLAKAGQFEPSIQEDQDVARRAVGKFVRNLLKRRRRAAFVQRLLDRAGRYLPSFEKRARASGHR
jgi:hypothetical protein